MVADSHQRFSLCGASKRASENSYYRDGPLRPSPHSRESSRLYGSSWSVSLQGQMSPGIARDCPGLPGIALRNCRKICLLSTPESEAPRDARSDSRQSAHLEATRASHSIPFCLALCYEYHSTPRGAQLAVFGKGVSVLTRLTPRYRLANAARSRARTGTCCPRRWSGCWGRR